MTVDGGELYGWRWPPGYEPMRVPGSTETFKGRGPAAGLPTLKDDAQKLAERIAEKYFNAPWQRGSEARHGLVCIIATELRAGGWRTE